MVKYVLGNEFRTKIIEGVRKAAEMITLSLGPAGKTVFIQGLGQKPFVTKDGATIASGFSLPDEYENIGALAVRQACEKSATISGDGTTTTALLINAMLQHTQKYLVAGANFVDIKNGILKACEYVEKALLEEAIPIRSKEDVYNIACISANNDKVIGKIVSEAIDSIGKDGSLVVENSKGFETVLKIVEGFNFSSGYVSPQFVNDERKQSVSYEDPMFFIGEYKFDTVAQMLPILEIAARSERPLVIVTEDVSGQALAALILNSLKKNMNVVAVKPPAYGLERRNILEDLAIAVGATFYSRESGLSVKDIKLSHFGSAKSVEILKGSTTVIDGKGDLATIQTRIDGLKELIKQTNDMDECKRIQERITRLASGVALILVGGNSDLEIIEKRHRIDDAIEACRAAIELGIVPGGGTMFYKISNSKELQEYIGANTINEDEAFGFKVVLKSIQEPFKKIVSNAGKNYEFIAAGCDFNQGFGYDAAKDVINTDMVKIGIVDPVKVLLSSLKHSASVVTMIVSSEAAIIEV